MENFLQIIRNFVAKPEAVDLVLASTFGSDYQIEKECIDKNGKFCVGTLTYGEKIKR